MNQFLTNYTEQTFLQRIQENLRKCDAFLFSVSFIKKAGLVLLAKDIESALQRGCTGRLITSTYQNFTDIESLRFFLKLQNEHPSFACHLDDDCFYDAKNYSTNGFHTKGYIFLFHDHVEIIVGSSNITRYALLKNIEWDLLLQEENNGPVYQKIKEEYDALWNDTFVLDEAHIDSYTQKLNYAIERWDMDYDVISSTIKPNYMQRNALKELNRYRAMGISRAIVVCSAGSGKTYLSAFDALNFNPKKLLYIVHESSILKKAMETFQLVFGTNVSYGLYTGESKEINADFLFSTNMSMMRNLELFRKDEFDYIVVDECHHIVADSYKKIIDYFEPEFLLGLTATPERMDNQDVLSLFDGNVPYELRLRDAIMNELVVPFHYYGIRDQLVDYGLNKDQGRKMIAQIASADHCRFIHEQIEAHRQDGKLKALIFCRNITHARMMSEALSEYYHTTYLTGKNTVGERIRAYDDLQDEKKELEVLCSVDILNEGVDIPGVNMVVFLRPTESSTIFIQQLGRGLRKYADKSFVTVLDFIGNSYKRSVQIALALGSLSQNLVLEKRLMMSMVQDNFSALDLQQYGVQIHIDDLSKEEIINYLENENFNQLSYMKKDYENFKKYIDTPFYPKHMDYLNNDCAPDLQRFMSVKINGKKTACYYNFLQGIGENDLPSFTDPQIDFLKYMSSLLPLVRPQEYQCISLLKEGIENEESLYQKIQPCSYKVFEHVMHFMKKDNIIQEDIQGYLSLNVSFDDDFKEHVNDLLEYGLTKYEAEYAGHNEPFLLWKSYQMNQVQRKLLHDPRSTQKGTYIYDQQVIIFASLKKDASIEEKLNYKDKFLTPSLFQWETIHDVSNKEFQSLCNSEYAYLFIRKVSEENGMVLPFIYVGKGRLTNPRFLQSNHSYLFDIIMEEEMPDYLQYDFQLTKEK